MSKAKHFYIPCLDGIRAISFLLVFLAHSCLTWMPAGLGVSIFFFLSGFLITTLLRMEYDKTRDIDLKKFYLRRVLRIFPPLYITYFLVVAGQHYFRLCNFDQVSLKAILFQVANLANYYMIGFGEKSLPVGTNVLWSLAVEEHYYLIYPLALCVFLKACGRWDKRRLFVILASTCGMVLLWRLILVFGLGESNIRVFAATDTRIDSIIYGCLMGACFNPLIDDLSAAGTRAYRLFRGDRLTVLAFIALVSASLVLSKLPYRFGQTFGFTFQGLAMLPLFIYILRNYRTKMVSWLENRVMVYLGRLSYTLYLIHFSIILVVRDTFGLKPIYVALIALGASVGYAAVMYYLVELPSARIRRNLEGSMVSATASRGAQATQPA